jgi:hypothetical protein
VYCIAVSGDLSNNKLSRGVLMNLAQEILADRDRLQQGGWAMKTWNGKEVFESFQPVRTGKQIPLTEAALKVFSDRRKEWHSKQ